MSRTLSSTSPAKGVRASQDGGSYFLFERFATCKQSKLIAALFAVFLCFGCGEPEDQTGESDAPSEAVVAESASESKLASSEDRISSEHFSIVIPDGWIQARIDEGKTKLMLVHGHKDGQDPTGMIKIDAGLPVERTAEATALEFANRFGSEVPPIAASLDGEDAFTVELSNRGLAGPQFVIATIHDNRLFLLMAAGQEPATVREAFNFCRESWRWKN